MTTGAGNLRKGGTWRRKVEVWLEEAGFHTLSRGLGYAGDDIYANQPKAFGSVNLSIEAKNHKSIELASFVDQAVRQAETYPAGDGVLPVVVVHRKGRGQVDDCYVVMPGWAWIEMVTR